MFLFFSLIRMHQINSDDDGDFQFFRKQMPFLLQIIYLFFEPTVRKNFSSKKDAKIKKNKIRCGRWSWHVLMY